MKFKIDENLPVELAADLESLGHEAHGVIQEQLAGADDPTIMQRVQQEERVLLTMDKGFGNLDHYPPQRHAGIVVFRPSRSGRGYVLKFIRQYLPKLLSLPLAGRLAVVSEAGVRLR